LILLIEINTSDSTLVVLKSSAGIMSPPCGTGKRVRTACWLYTRMFVLNNSTRGEALKTGAQ
jgi:hypothetical protein